MTMAAGPFAYVDVEDLLALAAERGEPPLLVVCDELSDPHNLGAADDDGGGALQVRVVEDPVPGGVGAENPPSWTA